MKKFKKLLIINIALVLSFVSLVGLINIPKADAAAPYTCTWTGAGGNSNFSTAGNWSGCNSAAPVATDGDNLVFDNTSLTSNQTLTNDITNLTLGSISFQGTNSNTPVYGYTLTGNAITVNSGINDSSNSETILNIDITLGGNATINDTTDDAALIIGDPTYTTNHVINLQAYNLTISGSAVTGTPCNSIQIFSSLSGSGTLTDNSSVDITSIGNSINYTGAIVVSSGVLALTSDSLGSSSSITVDQGATLDLQMNQSTKYAFPVVLNGGTLATDSVLGTILGACVGGGGVSTNNVVANLSGTLSLGANSYFYGGEYSGNNIPLNVSGTYSPGSYSLSLSNGSNGGVTLPGNKQITPSVQTINYDSSSPSTDITVTQNITAIVDGTYNIVTVNSGGILKGSGVMDLLEVNSGGIVAPGHSPGCLTSSSSLNLYGTYQAEIGGTTACSGYDQLVVGSSSTSNDVYLSDSNNNSAILQLSIINGFKPQVGQTFEIINNKGSGPVSGTFANLPEGSTINVNGNVFKISYRGGDGNDVVLTVITAASPNTGFAFTGFNVLYPVLGTAFVIGGIYIISTRVKKASISKR